MSAGNTISTTHGPRPEFLLSDDLFIGYTAIQVSEINHTPILASSARAALRGGRRLPSPSKVLRREPRRGQEEFRRKKQTGSAFGRAAGPVDEQF